MAKNKMNKTQLFNMYCNIVYALVAAVIVGCLMYPLAVMFQAVVQGGSK